MGPTFVKIGQLLSSRPDLLSEPYLKALSRLQDKVKPFPFAEVEETITRELGVRMSKAFSSFDPDPLAAASLGQVHRASLRDGRSVVVKVQRPGIRQQIAADFEMLEGAAGFLDRYTKMGRRHQFSRIIEEFRTTLAHELDYKREAANLTRLAMNLREFERIRVPLPIDDYTASSVLTMHYVSGAKITSLSPIVRLDIDGAALAEELFKAYLKQVLVDGFFHADPHPGNVFLTESGRLALLDLGMVGHTTPAMQEHLLKLLIAISEGKGEEAADVAIAISQASGTPHSADFSRRVAQIVSEQQDDTLETTDVGRTLLKVGRAAGENGLLVPSELTMLGKTLIQLDTIGKTLAPEFNPNAAIRRNVSEILSQRMSRNLSAGQLWGGLLEFKDFVGGLPHRVNKILDAAAASEFELKIKALDTPQLMDGVQKIANRITTGLILAALIVGASLMMRIETSFQLFGYPGLAILCFIFAAGCGAWLVATILIKDHRDKRKLRADR